MKAYVIKIRLYSGETATIIGGSKECDKIGYVYSTLEEAKKALKKFSKINSYINSVNKNQLYISEIYI